MNPTQTQEQVMQPVQDQPFFVEPQGDDAENKQARAKIWKQRFADAETNQQGNFKKWNDWYGMMYAATNTPKMALWRSKAFLPIIAGKVWDLVSRFVQYRPSWEVKLYAVPISMPTAELQAYLANVNQMYDKVKMKLDYDYDNPVRPTGVQDEHFSTLVDAVVTGTGIARVSYEQETEEVREHPVDVFGNVDMANETIGQIQHGFNNYESVNIFNFYIAPTAKSLQGADWLLTKDAVGKAELKAHPEYDQAAIDSVIFGVIADANAQNQTNKRKLQGEADPFSVDTTEQKAWLFDCWDRHSGKHTIYLMGGNSGDWVEIYREDNPYWHKKYPFVRFVIRQKPHIFWGESIFENSESLQAAINDLFNHYMDNYNMSDGMLAVEEGSVVEPYIVEPGGEFRYRGEKPTQLRFPEPNPAQLTTIMNQIYSVIESVTISQYASGTPNSATDNTMGTATGITRLMEAATEKIGMMRSNIRRSWSEVGNMWLLNSQQFMQEPIITEKTTGRGKVAEMVYPNEIQGRFVLRIDENAFEPVSQDQQRDNYVGYVANIQAWAQASREQAQANGTTDGIINIDYLNAVERFSELSSENAGSILLDAPVQQMPQEDTGGLDFGSGAMDSLMPADGATLPEIPAVDMFQGMNSGVATPDTMPLGIGEQANAMV